MSKAAKIITVFAAGVAAGVVLGILFAPGKGSETRKKIADAGKKFAGGGDKNQKKRGSDIQADGENNETEVQEAAGNEEASV